MAKSTCFLMHPPDVAVISLLWTDEVRNRADEVRFGRFTSALVRGGCSAIHHQVKNVCELLSILETDKPDIVFSALDSLPGEYAPPPTPGHLNEGPSLRKSDPSATDVHSLLVGMEIPFVGSSSDTIRLALSKTDMKERWLREAVTTPAFLRVKAKEFREMPEPASFPPFPCIVKPAAEGNSRGICDKSVVYTPDELSERIRVVLDEFDEVLVEEYLGGYSDFQEYTVSMIGMPGRILLMPAELVFKTPKRLPLITNGDKEGNRTLARAIEDPETRERVVAFAGRAFAAARVRDYSRCDMAFAKGRFQAIEINGQPMVPDPWFESCARHAGLDETAYLNAIVLAALCRCIREGSKTLFIPDGMRDVIPSPFYDTITG